ncbi:MAG: ferredoxin--NADP reductase [Cycloclasticus sp.]
MAKYTHETVLQIHHWNDSLFSFKTTRSDSLRFRNGEFLMIGLAGETRPIMRAYSIASANYEEHMEFYSIIVPDGVLTSKLQKIKVGDEVLIGSKPTGTLVIDDLTAGKNLYLLGTGTGLAPYLSLTKDPDIYQQFDKIILFHGVRHISELGYYQWLNEELANDEFLGEMVSKQLIYYPSTTRDDFKNQGRITDLLRSGKIESDIGLPPICKADDRFMLCGSPAMLADSRKMLDEMGFESSARAGVKGDYVFERSFVD